jgi:hypothetical protein
VANDLTESAFGLKLSRHLRTLLKMKLTLYLFEERKAHFLKKLNIYKKIALNTHSRLRSERHEKEK